MVAEGIAAYSNQEIRRTTYPFEVAYSNQEIRHTTYPFEVAFL